MGSRKVPFCEEPFKQGSGRRLPRSVVRRGEDLGGAAEGAANAADLVARAHDVLADEALAAFQLAHRGQAKNLVVQRARHHYHLK